MFLNIQIDFLIYYGQFTLTTKKSLHIILKVNIGFTLQGNLAVFTCSAITPDDLDET